MSEKSYRVPAVENAIKIIQTLCESNTPLNLTQIAKAANTNNNMAYRILKTLQAQDWVIQEQPGPTYQMSLQPFHYTSMPAARTTLMTAASQIIYDFWKKHGECCFLGVIDDNRVLYLEALEQTYGPVKVSVSRGGRYVMHTAAPGKVLLAYDKKLTDQIISEGLERFTDNTITDGKAFKKELELTKERGYALDDEEGARGLICLAVPIFNAEKSVVGSFGISVLTANYKNLDVMFDCLGQEVLDVAEKISISLGYVSNK
ncbi:IclR family transcriptional regulator [Lentisphaerota bacterium WC36G]|nr:IclR family transcriptional regulator [Lentisphaerae bacterium WC36]